MFKPVVLMIGANPEWDMAPLGAAYDLRKHWLTDDKQAFLAEVAPMARAIATRAELGASMAQIERCPSVAHGAFVDEPALISALQTKQIGGAALDEFLNEPDIDARLLGFDNVQVQPHQSSGTVETRKAMGKLVRDNLEAHFADRPLLTPVV